MDTNTETNLKVFGQHDEATIEQMKRCIATGGEKGVLCADGHKGYAQPIGGVVAYRDRISISGVGFDIACGNLAYCTDAKLADVQPRIEQIMNDVVRTISFGIGRINKAPVDHELFTDAAWELEFVKPLMQLAREQLGTVGGGNHYVDIFADEQDRIWVGVHFGSRGLGHKTATAFLKAAGGKDGMDVPPATVAAGTALHDDYIAAMKLAGRYAYAGREYVAGTVVHDILSANILDAVHNHHNFAWEEEHDGEKLWVVRKGATPAFPGQRGFIGGSMGDDAVIVEGLESPMSRDALFSTVHGAGRIMSRTQAAGKSKWVHGQLKRVTPGAVSREAMLDWVRQRGVALRGGGCDEAPQVYRRLNEVLAAHAGTIRILHTLRPLGVAMAGEKTRDPYKD